MTNSQLRHLMGSPFDGLRALLDPLSPPEGLDSYAMTIGEPQHQPPQLMLDSLRENEHLYGKYPPIAGTADLRLAIREWLDRRYRLPDGMLDADTQILPANGTKEALYLIAQLVTDRRTAGGKQPAILLPNPYYHVYHAAAVMSGAEPVMLSATLDNNFLPDLDALDEDLLARTSAFYLCTPSNPQGTVASKDYLRRALELARQYDFILFMDECYAEIYDREPPTGILEIAASLGGGLENIIAFHSLSKRSSAPGLRSGFMVGHTDLMRAFANLRNFAGAASPLPVCAAAAALWRDEAHVIENRNLYRLKLDIAERKLGNRFGFYRPPGGFFLWLNVGDGEKAAIELWRKGALRVLPGKYLSVTDPAGVNPGAEFIRVALVANTHDTEEALTRLADCL